MYSVFLCVLNREDWVAATMFIQGMLKCIPQRYEVSSVIEIDLLVRRVKYSTPK